jgi:hypothetical protein
VITLQTDTNVASTEVTENSFLDNVILFINDNKLFFTVLCFIGFLVCTFLFFRNTKSDIKKSSKTGAYIKRFKYFMRTVYVRLMRYVNKIPVVGDIVNSLCYSYKCQEALTDDDAYVKTGETLFMSMLAFLMAFAFGFRWFSDIILSIITGIMIAHVVMNSLRPKSKVFLTGLHNATEDFLMAYHKSSGNLDAAFYAVEMTDNPVAKHFEIMHDYIKRAYISDNPDLIQREYNDIAPSRFLRNLYNIMYMTYKYGDQKVNGKSVLNMNIMEIQEQIGDALYQQNKLIDDTMGERWFIIVPLYSIPLLGAYMLEYFSFEGFEYIPSFLSSSTGYMVEVLCAIIALICYLLYTQMVNRGVLEVKSRSSWEKQVLRNAYIRKLVLKLLPLDSPKRQKQQAVLAKAGSSDSPNALQIQRIFLASFMLVISIISISFNMASNSMSIDKDIYTGLSKDNYTKILMTQEDMYVYIDEMLEADKVIVNHFRKDAEYQKMTAEQQADCIENYIKANDLEDVYRGYLDYGVTRIQAKINLLAKIGGLNNVLFVLMLTGFGYYIPYWMLLIRSAMNKDMLLIDEVSDLQKTTIMLMGYPTTSPENLLGWYASSATMLGPQIRECVITHDFDKLMHVVEYKPFTQLITSLKMAFDGLEMKEAFSGVEQRLLTQRREQNRVMERMLKFRVDTVEMLASISMGAVFGLYMFMPLMVAMIQMFLSLDMFSI